MTLLFFVVGLMIGGCVGFLLAAVLVMSDGGE
jgi:hypothetical protein